MDLFCIAPNKVIALPTFVTAIVVSLLRYQSQLQLLIENFSISPLKARQRDNFRESDTEKRQRSKSRNFSMSISEKFNIARLEKN